MIANEAADNFAKMSRTLFILLTGLAIVAATSHLTPIICNRPNEEYQCGSACQRECATLGEACPIVNIRCNDGCYCIDGYARNEQGRCIPIEDCPIRPRQCISGC